MKKLKDVIKKNPEPARKANVDPGQLGQYAAQNQVSEGALERYLKSMGIDPRFASMSTKVSKAKSGEFAKWKRDRAFKEDVTSDRADGDARSKDALSPTMQRAKRLQKAQSHYKIQPVTSAPHQNPIKQEDVKALDNKVKMLRAKTRQDMGEEVVSEANITHAAHFDDPKTGKWASMALLTAKNDQDAVSQAHDLLRTDAYRHYKLSAVERHEPVKNIKMKEEVINEISPELQHRYFKAAYAQQPNRSKQTKNRRKGMDKVINRTLKRNVLDTTGADKDFKDQEKKRGIGQVRDHVEHLNKENVSFDPKGATHADGLPPDNHTQVNEKKRMSAAAKLQKAFGREMERGQRDARLGKTLLAPKELKQAGGAAQTPKITQEGLQEEDRHYVVSKDLQKGRVDMVKNGNQPDFHPTREKAENKANLLNNQNTQGHIQYNYGGVLKEDTMADRIEAAKINGLTQVKNIKEFMFDEHKDMRYTNLMSAKKKMEEQNLLRLSRVTEDLYDHEKEDKSVATYGKKPKFDKADKDDSKGEKKPEAAAVMSGGTTLTGTKRDTIEIDPMMRARPGQPDPTKKKEGEKDGKEDKKKDK